MSSPRNSTVVDVDRVLLDRSERWSYLLDAKFRVPGTQIYFGWDAMVGIIPIVGDLATAAIGLKLISDARQLGATGGTVARMLGNLAVDIVIGATPVIGPIFDTFYRSNLRNLQLLLNDLGRRPRAATTR